MSYRGLKDEINYLKLQKKGYEDRLNKYKDTENELREKLKSLKAFEEISKEYENEKKSTKITFSYYKKLIQKVKDRINQINSDRSEDIFNRMELDKKKIISQISLIDNQYSRMLDDIKEKILNLNLIKDLNEIKSKINPEKIKQRYIELKQLKEKIQLIFNDIHDIYNIANTILSQQYDQMEWEINIFNHLLIEIKRISNFVPVRELINPMLLAQLGMLDNKYSNDCTSLAIIQNLNIKLKQRQNEIKTFIEQIQQTSKKVLLDENSIRKLITNTIKGFSSIISFEETGGNDKNNNLNIIEEIFNEAKNINSSQCQSFSDLISKDFDNEMQEMRKRAEEEKQKRINKTKKANEEFEKRWKKRVLEKCKEISNKFQKEAGIYFYDKKSKYVKDIDKIVDIFKQNTKNYIPRALLGCEEEINEARENYNNFKKLKNYALLMGGNDNILNKIVELNCQGYRTKNECYAKSTSSLINYIKGSFFLSENIPFEALSICLVYPIEIERIDILKNKLFDLFNYSLDLDIGFCILITNQDLKGSNYFEKKNEITKYFKNNIEESKKIKFKQIEDLFITNLDDLSYNLGKFLDYVYKIKRDYCLTINLEELKEEYFRRMFRVYHTRTRATETDSIKNAESEKIARTRLFNSIYEFSIESILLQQKNIQINDKDLTKITNFISKFLDKLYTENLREDCTNCLHIMIEKMVYLLFIEREGIRTQIDLEFDTDLCLEDFEVEDIKKRIYKDIDDLIMKNFFTVAEKEAGKIMWIIFYDEYCADFNKYFEIDFEIPKDFNKFFRDYEEEMEMKQLENKHLNL